MFLPVILDIGIFPALVQFLPGIVAVGLEGAFVNFVRDSLIADVAREPDAIAMPAA